MTGASFGEVARELNQHIEALARELLGEPNRQLSSRKQLRFGRHGSITVEIAGAKQGQWYDHENGVGGDGIELICSVKDCNRRDALEFGCNWLGIAAAKPNGKFTNGASPSGFADIPGDGTQFKIIKTYDYRDENGELLFQVCRLDPKDFRQRRPDGKRGWIWKTADIRKVLYRLPELIAAPVDRWVFIAEGEKDVDNLVGCGLVATTNPGGAAKQNGNKPARSKWLREFNEFFRGRRVCVLPDNDDSGRAHAEAAAGNLAPLAADLRIVELPGIPEKGDVSDWLDAGGTREALLRLVEETPAFVSSSPDEAETPLNAEGISLEDFRAYMPGHTYLYVPTGEMWPAASVNARIPPVNDAGSPKPITASSWLDKNKSVEQMTWAPGLLQDIPDRLISDGGWIERPGVCCYNLYRGPTVRPGDPGQAGPWLDHAHKVFADDAGHIIDYLAQRVQRPEEKINHGLVLGGEQGIGKDTLLEPVKAAVGPWNFKEIGPRQLSGRFNGFVKAVILRISEAHDLGEIDRFQFYEHLKTLTAAPPDVLRVDEKFLREYSVINCCGVIITTNHKTDGIYLPPDDRRHFVAWSDRKKDDFSEEYWTELYRWYADGGTEHVAAYLKALDISKFNAKAPPPRTQAFWEIVDASQAPEDAELADVLDKLGRPDIVTVSKIVGNAEADFSEWLKDRKNARRIPHRLEACGYVAVRNDGAKDGLWKIVGKRQVIYGKDTLTPRERIDAANRAIGAW